MASPYTPTGKPLDLTRGSAPEMRTEFALIQSSLATMVAGWTWSGSHDYTAGTVLVATQPVTDSSTKAASTAFVSAKAFQAALPAQTGNAGKLVTTDGTNASWSVIGTAGQVLKVNQAGTAIVGGSLPGSDIYLAANYGGF